MVGAGLASGYVLRLAAEHPRQVRGVALVAPPCLPVSLDRGDSGSGSSQAPDTPENDSAYPPLRLGSELEVFAGSRELPHAEQPLAWSRALARYIARLPA